MIPPEERAKSTLRAICRYGTRHPRWPDAHALRREFPKLGCRATIQSTLARLKAMELVVLTGRGATARWEPTPLGFSILNKPPFRPALAKRQDRAAADALLAQPIPKPPVVISASAAIAMSANLEIME